MVTWFVVDVFGFAWGGPYTTKEEAHEALCELNKDTHIREWGIDLEIERREG